MTELLLPRLKREIEARLTELRPLVEEARQLHAAKRALLEDLAPARTRRVAAPRESASDAPPASAAGDVAARTPAPAPRPPRDPATQASSLIGRDTLRSSAPATRRAKVSETPAEPITISDVIVRLVEERPGVSIAEIASVTRTEKSAVATIVSKLKRDGVFADEAGGVKLASRQPLTLAGVATPARKETASDAEWDAARPGGSSNGASG